MQNLAPNTAHNNRTRPVLTEMKGRLSLLPPQRDRVKPDGRALGTERSIVALQGNETRGFETRVVAVEPDSECRDGRQWEIEAAGARIARANRRTLAAWRVERQGAIRADRAIDFERQLREGQRPLHGSRTALALQKKMRAWR